MYACFLRISAGFGVAQPLGTIVSFSVPCGVFGLYMKKADEDVCIGRILSNG